MDYSFLFKMFAGLPRQGPGSNACTRKAFSLLTDLPAKPEIADIGCGAGMQTVELARICPECRITAVDIYQPYLDALRRNAEDAGVNDRITTVRASMDDLPLPDASFDVVWAEGSIFVIGLAEGLAAWKRLLRPGGYLCLTESAWFTDTPSEEAEAFWLEVYPEIKTVRETAAVAAAAGYDVLGSFRLPASAWWDDYYAPFCERLVEIRASAAGNADAEAVVANFEREIAVYREHADEYGYAFFILRTRED